MTPQTNTPVALSVEARDFKVASYTIAELWSLIDRLADALDANAAEIARLREALKASQSDDAMHRLVMMVLDLLTQRAEFSRLANEALAQRDAARQALGASR